MMNVTTAVKGMLVMNLFLNGLPIEKARQQAIYWKFEKRNRVVDSYPTFNTPSSSMSPIS